MDLRGLNIFIQVAEQGSFTRAGELLGYSQPTISFQIRLLEQELGVPLFDRIGHTVSLTDAGRQALEYAQRICNLSREMHSSAQPQGQVQGHVRVGMADSLCQSILSGDFGEFRRRHPGITLKISSGGTAELLRMLDHNEVDMVCTLDSHVYDSSYIIAREAPVRAHFVAAPSNPLSAQRQLSIRDLMGQAFLLTERGMSYRRIMEEQLSARSLQIHPVLELGQTDILCRLVQEDLGISFLPEYVTREAWEQGRLIRLDVEDVTVEVWQQILYRREKWLSPQMKALLAWLGKS